MKRNLPINDLLNKWAHEFTSYNDTWNSRVNVTETDLRVHEAKIVLWQRLFDDVKALYQKMEFDND